MSVVDKRVRGEVLVATNGLMHKLPFEERFKILGCALNRQEKTLDAMEERMQSANKAFWKDIMVCRRKDVPWRIKLVDHVNSVFSFGSENWSSQWTDSRGGRLR